MLFTVILEHRSIARTFQRRARSIEDIADWLCASPGWLDPAKGEREVRIMPEDHPTALDGIDGVWCMTPDIDGTMALVNIVRTSDELQSTNLSTIILIVSSGTYIKQATFPSKRELIDQLNNVLDWHVLDPPANERRLVGVREVGSLPSASIIEGRVDAKPAELVIVATQPSNARRDSY